MSVFLLLAGGNWWLPQGFSFSPTALPIKIRVKFDRLIGKLEHDARLLREPDTKPLGDGLFEIRTMGTWSSSPREFHPQALTQPDVNLSIHPAPIVPLFRHE